MKMFLKRKKVSSLLLQEANKKIDTFKDDLASKVSKHQISIDAIKELTVKIEEI